MSQVDYISYKDAGVDIEYGEESVKDMKPAAQQTYTKGVISGIGGFAGLFSLKDAVPNMLDPILVSGTDGVGTKLLVAIEADRHEAIGQDLVAMCANDVLCVGAKPLFFLDYFASSNMAKSPLVRVVQSIAKACRQIDCVLIGGESAELPGLYSFGHYDLAGFCVGAVDRKDIVDGKTLKPGDEIIGLFSSGLHSNGFSLARKIISERMGKSIHDQIDAHSEVTFADILLEPTKLYVKSILSLREEKIPIKAMAHITGGGMTGNLLRPFPKGLSAIIDSKTWKEPPIFNILRNHGPVHEDEMRRTFNLGIGFAIIVEKAHTKAVLDLLSLHQEPAALIGRVVENDLPVYWIG